MTNDRELSDDRELTSDRGPNERELTEDELRHIASGYGYSRFGHGSIYHP